MLINSDKNNRITSFNSNIPHLYNKYHYKKIPLRVVICVNVYAGADGKPLIHLLQSLLNLHSLPNIDKIVEGVRIFDVLPFSGIVCLLTFINLDTSNSNEVFFSIMPIQNKSFFLLLSITSIFMLMICHNL